MEVRVWLHATAALPPGKELPIPIEQEAGWAPEPETDSVAKRKISCPCQKSKPGRPAGILVSILIEAVRLPW
jgi:hypothetical protein